LENGGKLLLDLSKLTFGSLVLGIIIKGEIEHSTLLLTGIIVSAIGAVIGLLAVSILEE
jgi:hypothetical protein